MALFGKPRIPPIQDEIGVVRWLLRYDPKLIDFRTIYQGQVLALEKSLTIDLKACPDVDHLAAYLNDLSREYDELLMTTASIVKLGGPNSGDDHRAVLREATVAAKLRVLGYFLKMKHGIDPVSVTEPQHTSAYPAEELALEVRASIFARSVYELSSEYLRAVESDPTCQSTADSRNSSYQFQLRDAVLAFHLLLTWQYGVAAKNGRDVSAVPMHVFNFLDLVFRERESGEVTRLRPAMSSENRVDEILKLVDEYNSKWGHLAVVWRPSPERHQSVLGSAKSGMESWGASLEQQRSVRQFLDAQHEQAVRLWLAVPAAFTTPVTLEPLESQLWCFAKNISTIVGKGEMDPDLHNCIVAEFSDRIDDFLDLLASLFAFRLR